MSIEAALSFRLLDDPLVRWRSAGSGEVLRTDLPSLFAAMAADRLRDFPALRAHQRHPWHAFLAQLGAIALHKAGQFDPWTDPAEWRAALLALTPEDPDGAAWCLVAPPERPALLQPPVPGEKVEDWKNLLLAPDELDMLVTSKNHDFKRARAHRAEPDDWLFALVSLQTQQGEYGSGNAGISRMNKGYGNRPGVGVARVGSWCARWLTDVAALLANRDQISNLYGLKTEGGHALLWLIPWSGQDAPVSMALLDPLYVEICRRVRLQVVAGRLCARTTTSSGPRLLAKELRGVTGDPWTPIETAEPSALTVSVAGLNYKLMNDLITGSRFTHGAAWRLDGWPQDAVLEVIAQATVRGQGKTEGYHERRVPISPRLRRLLAGPQRATVATIAKQRVEAIAAVGDLLWSSLVLLFANGDGDERNNAIGKRASRFARPFEHREDVRFFDDLSLEAEADEDERAARRLQWLLGLVERAEVLLIGAFDAGPRASMLRYKARSAALSRFHGGLRGAKAAVPALAAHYAEQRALRMQQAQGEMHE